MAAAVEFPESIPSLEVSKVYAEKMIKGAFAALELIPTKIERYHRLGTRSDLIACFHALRDTEEDRLWITTWRSDLAFALLDIDRGCVTQEYLDRSSGLIVELREIVHGQNAPLGFEDGREHERVGRQSQS